MIEMIEIPIGYSILWGKKNPIPEGWIQEDNYIDYYNRENIILIKKVDNLTWFEHLAKERHLV